MKLLNKYLNGNVTVTLFDNGTKIQEWSDNEQPNPLYPNSMDIKITNYCDLGCAWCHEKSNTQGVHADLEYLLDILQWLPRGTELAIGGGNPLSHPGLVPFLETCKSMGLVPNLTVNYYHILPQYSLINKLLNNKLIYGLGLSIPDDFTEDTINLIERKENCVYHVIAGVNELSVLDKIKESSIKKCLILGYKDVGRGKFHHSTSTDRNLNNWIDNIGQYIRKVHLSFDNLSLKQLNIKQYLTEKDWNSFYMGDDGVFTFYIDAVTKTYSKSSTYPDKFNLKLDIKEIFEHVKSLK